MINVKLIFQPTYVAQGFPRSSRKTAFPPSASLPSSRQTLLGRTCYSPAVKKERSCCDWDENGGKSGVRMTLNFVIQQILAQNVA